MQNKRKRIKDKIKKTIAIAVIANILLSLFCLSAFANRSNLPDSITFNQGDILVFKNNPNVSQNLNIISNSYSNDIYRIKNPITNNPNYAIESELRVYNGELQTYLSYNNTVRQFYYIYNGTEWANELCKSIEFKKEYTITNQDVIVWLYNNVESGLPFPDNIKNSLENAKEFYSTSLNFGSILISFVTANAITIIPIILFVFIALIGCGIALIKRK